MYSLLKFTINHPLITIATFAIITALLFPGLLNLRTDVSIESILPPDDPAQKNYQEYIEHFGNETALLAFLKFDNPYSNFALAKIAEFVNRVKEIPSVRGTFSLLDVAEVRWQSIVPSFVRIAEGMPLSEQMLVKLAEVVENTHLYKSKVVSLDNSFAIVIIALDRIILEQENKRDDSVTKVEEIAAALEDGSEILITGSPLLKKRMKEIVIRDFSTLAPIVMLIGFTVVLISFRSLWALTVSATSTLTALIWSMSIFFLTGFSLTMATILLPSLVMALNFSQVIFILSKYRRTVGESATRIFNTMQKVITPCFLAAITTSIGLLTLLVTPAVPVRDFGVTAAMSILLSFVITTFLVPAMLSLRPLAIKSLTTERVSTWAEKLARLSKQHGIVLALASIIIALSVVGVSYVRIDTSPYSYFDADQDIVRANRLRLKATGAETSINLMLRNGSERIDSKTLESISRFAVAISSLENVVEVQTMLTLSELINQDNNITINAKKTEMLIPILNLLPEGTTVKRVLNTFISTDNQVARALVFLKNNSAESVSNVVSSIEEIARDVVPRLSVVPTGQTVLFAQTVSHLFTSQMTSIVLIIVFITVVVSFAFKSIKIGLISLIPNISPIIITIGLMGFFDIPLNIITIMVSSIAIGIAVDDTIHFLHFVRERLNGENNYNDCIDAAQVSLGRPILINSLLLATAFISYVFSGFYPIRYLGILTAFTMIGALIGDLIILPTLLKMFRPHIAKVTA